MYDHPISKSFGQGENLKFSSMPRQRWMLKSKYLHLQMLFLHCISNTFHSLDFFKQQKIVIQLKDHVGLMTSWVSSNNHSSFLYVSLG